VGQVNMANTRSGTSIDTEDENPWDYPDPFTVSITPSASGIDGLNHTNNAVYVQWCEAVAWSHSKSIGLDISDYHRLDRGMAIRRGEYDYLLPSSLGDKLILGTWLTASDGKLTLERRFQLVREADHATILRGRWELVCIELSSGNARRMPLEFRQVYLPVVCFQDGRRNLEVASDRQAATIP
jgi:acyl-CoA thioester hydrolase